MRILIIYSFLITELYFVKGLIQKYIMSIQLLMKQFYCNRALFLSSIMSRNQLTRRIILSNLSVYLRRRFILSSMEIRKQPPIIPTQAGIVKMCTSLGDLQSICYTYILFYSSYLRSFTVPFCLFCRSLFAEEPPLKIYSVIKIMLNMASKKMLFFKIL